MLDFESILFPYFEAGAKPRAVCTGKNQWSLENPALYVQQNLIR